MPSYAEEKGIKPKSARKPEELRKIKKIEKIFEESGKTYGYRKIWEYLQQEGYEINKK